MYVKNMRMHEICRLRELPLEPGVLNTEAYMLVLKRRSFPDKKERVFKYMDAQDDTEIMSRKHFVVTTLNKMHEYTSMDELVIPDTLIYVDGNLVGFGMPLIYQHRNLGSIVNDPKIPLSFKLPYLEQMGNIIDKVERVNTSLYRLQFGDLNEFNFIIDKEDRVKAIDLDSSYLGSEEPSDMAYYLLKNPYIRSLPDKYKSTNHGIIIPTDDTDLYCYNMILLNALAKENIYRHDIDVYYDYMDYIKDLGLPSALLESFYNIYIPKSNLNPKDSLREIDPSLEAKLDFKVFQKEYNKR